MKKRSYTHQVQTVGNNQHGSNSKEDQHNSQATNSGQQLQSAWLELKGGPIHSQTGMTSHKHIVGLNARRWRVLVMDGGSVANGEVRAAVDGGSMGCIVQAMRGASDGDGGANDGCARISAGEVACSEWRTHGTGYFLLVGTCAKSRAGFAVTGSTCWHVTGMCTWHWGLLEVGGRGGCWSWWWLWLRCWCWCDVSRNAEIFKNGENSEYIRDERLSRNPRE
ncbi:uncharacterized protein EDB93DRAFT_1100291 [Suillus bovinus]|uniref:uncharacterized protein n=1 Tax=Suillus bovinus TaxID=48563 RepID=UPI001B8817B5|nr:uncharacterized protein EDB93DRAFT_1100291 [Suillus bovinus]KAG2158636.1 hypothetical protein EDB93DRAFT_1100291 [Suillus bovinus]